MSERFRPRFDQAGLLTAVVVHADTGAPLMVAHMNAQALALTRETRRAHFWSRSREALWMKGETSGNILDVDEILVDCDQDCVLLRARPRGPACHTGAASCFFRTLDGDMLRRHD
jgi:phosphoribosyl-AMP cyclohydrolase